MAKFKKGDIVICKDARECSCLSYGKRYTVESYAGDLLVLYGVSGGYKEWRFNLVTETHVPLYSEEQAIAFLKEKGYSVCKHF